MNLKSFSQNDTINSTIQLTKPVAKLVIKDLINADGLSLELKTTQDLLNSTNLKLKTQTELVGNLQTQIYNFENRQRQMCIRDSYLCLLLQHSTLYTDLVNYLQELNSK